MEKAWNYQKMAAYYDTLMKGIDYEAWVDYVEAVIKRFDGSPASVVDLACGTGGSTLPWAKRGYQTIGVDLSENMLEIARHKAQVACLRIDYIRQDLTSLQLPERADLAVCFQDGFNYILDAEKLQRAFEGVYQNLNRGGLFVFDLNYLPRLIPVDEESSLAVSEHLSIIWKSRYLESEKLWEIQVRFLVREAASFLETFSESHCERIYELEEVWSWLAAQGFTILGSYRAFSFDLPSEKTPKVVCVARKE